MSLTAHKLLKIAQVLKSNGTDGELIIGFRNISPEDIDIQEPVFIHFDGLPVPFFIESFSRRGTGKAIVKLSDINCSDDADEIVGRGLYADTESVATEGLEDDFSFLVGWDLVDGTGKNVGKISQFMDIPGNPCIEVMTGTGKILIPLHEDLIISAEAETGLLKMDLPAGLENI